MEDQSGPGLAGEPSATASHVEGDLIGGQGLSLYWQGWLTAGEPRGLVVIAHGAFEHGGRYAHVGEALAQQGFATYALDHRGHGRSEGRRANVGRMAYLVADLDKLVGLVADRHPNARLFLLGHSMGGAIAVQYALEHQDKLAGLILSGPAIDVSAVSSLTLRISKLLSALAPNLGILKIDSSEISRDPEVVRAYDEDPLVYRGRAPVRSVAEILSAGERFPGRVGDLGLPLLLLHGSDDALAAQAGSRLIYERASSTDKTLELYDGLYHEILNEPEKEAVIGDALAWLSARSERSS